MRCWVGLLSVQTRPLTKFVLYKRFYSNRKGKFVFIMENKSLYLKLKSSKAKSLIRHCFVSEVRMEFIGDAIHDITVFACSENLFNNNDVPAVCYFECHSSNGYQSLKHLIGLLLGSESYVWCTPKYCCDNVFTQGYCIWRLD